uniref:Uncharacterized protein n=1 Tax=Anguilla anguilla TaxID=7936 RepID=A0A0E9PJ88_ANGAN
MFSTKGIMLETSNNITKRTRKFASCKTAAVVTLKIKWAMHRAMHRKFWSLTHSQTTFVGVCAGGAPWVWTVLCLSKRCSIRP